MGSYTDTAIYKGTSAKDAYETAYDQARYEHGNGGYTGTIAESSGFVEVRPRTRYEAEKAAHTLTYDGVVDGTTASKWGHAVMIPLIPSVSERTIVMPLDVTGIPSERADWTRPDPWEVAAEKAVKEKLRLGEHIVSLKYVRKLPEKNWEYEQADEHTRKAYDLCKRATGSDVRRTKGDRRTVWAVMVGGVGQTGLFSRTSVLLVTDDLEQAKEAARERTLRNTLSKITDQPVGIVQWTVRDSGTGFLYEASASVAKEVVGIVAVIGKQGAGKPQEWMTVGCYSS